ncbi:MAG: hypothetical protein PW844_19010 [Pantoea sp.]|uniref:hypothetical protein n=1 Tax=Pantoea sp. TaxID=69393 RepID=UPI002394C5BC|nr:hypothetical protein [Pantoea sp.]MDE1188539.1 hypothetical protein [Pantoea sp.]
MMPIIESQAQRDALIERIDYWFRLLNLAPVSMADSQDILIMKVARAALESDTSKLAELAERVRKVREDAKDFDGDRRGMWEYQEEQEALLLEEAVKYTTPPVPSFKPMVMPGADHEADGGYKYYREETVRKFLREAGIPVVGDDQ